ncbi:Coiled-coil domain-containing protein [Dirofilaria immitis]
MLLPSSSDVSNCLFLPYCSELNSISGRSLLIFCLIPCIIFRVLSSSPVDYVDCDTLTSAVMIPPMIPQPSPNIACAIVSDADKNFHCACDI